MSSSSAFTSVSSQYAAAATVPLIKSPSLHLPRPVEMPNDIHPLPDDITAYFVYPFTLEHHVLSLQPPPHDAIAQRRARNAEILHRREEEEERREKEALHKVAPGYNPSIGLLVPTSALAGTAPGVGTQTREQRGGPVDLMGEGAQGGLGSETMGLQFTTGRGDPMDDLVSGLEAMKSRR